MCGDDTAAARALFAENRDISLLRGAGHAVRVGIGVPRRDDRKAEIIGDRVILFIKYAVEVLVDADVRPEHAVRQGALGTVRVLAAHHREHVIDHIVAAASVGAQVDDEVLRVVGGGVVERLLKGLDRLVLERVEVENIGIARAVERRAVFRRDNFELRIGGLLFRDKRVLSCGDCRQLSDIFDDCRPLRLLFVKQLLRDARDIRNRVFCHCVLHSVVRLRVTAVVEVVVQQADARAVVLRVLRLQQLADALRYVVIFRERLVKALFADAVGEHRHRRLSVDGVHRHAKLVIAELRHRPGARILELALTAARVQRIGGAFEEQLAVPVQHRAACVGEEIAERTERQIDLAVVLGDVDVIPAEVEEKGLDLVLCGEAVILNIDRACRFLLGVRLVVLENEVLDAVAGERVLFRVKRQRIAAVREVIGSILSLLKADLRRKELIEIVLCVGKGDLGQVVAEQTRERQRRLLLQRIGADLFFLVDVRLLRIGRAGSGVCEQRRQHQGQGQDSFHSGSSSQSCFLMTALFYTRHLKLF